MKLIERVVLSGAWLVVLWLALMVEVTRLFAWHQTYDLLAIAVLLLALIAWGLLKTGRWRL